jgi:hypothetical protein
MKKKTKNVLCKFVCNLARKKQTKNLKKNKNVVCCKIVCKSLKRKYSVFVC